MGDILSWQEPSGKNCELRLVLCGFAASYDTSAITPLSWAGGPYRRYLPNPLVGSVVDPNPRRVGVTFRETHFGASYKLLRTNPHTSSTNYQLWRLEVQA